MNPKILIELFGYLGSALVVISMLMTSVKKLRIVNTTGSVIFAIYALIIQSYPTAVMNFCLVTINLYQLYKLRRRSTSFSFLEEKAGTEAIRKLLMRYENDIRAFFPYAQTDALLQSDAFFLVTCDTTPVGLLIGNRKDEGTIQIEIDYSVPAYRDASVGAFLHQALPSAGVRTLIFNREAPSHEAYLVKMGYEKTPDGYRLNL